MSNARIQRVDWPGEEPTYEVRTPGRGTSDDWEPGECLGVFETRSEAEAFISPPTTTETHFQSLKDGAGSENGSPTFPPSVGRTTSTQAYRAMEAAFIRWHVTGCFAAAADYQKARQAWELALMDQPTA